MDYIDKNLLNIEGNLVRDPESKVVGGYSLTEFTIASSLFGKNRDGSKRTGFFNVKTWRDVAEFCIKNLSKGSKVILTGSLDFETWVGKDGKNQSKITISAKSVDIKTFFKKSESQIDPFAQETKLGTISDDDIQF